MNSLTPAARSSWTNWSRLAFLTLVVSLFGNVLLLAQDKAPKLRRDLSGNPLPPGAIARLDEGNGLHGRGAFSPHGDMFLGPIGFTYLWDVRTGKRFKVAPRSSAYFSASGEALVASRSDDRRSIVAHEVMTGKERFRIELGKLPGYARIIVSAKHRTLVVEFKPRSGPTFVAYDATSGELLSRMKWPGKLNPGAFGTVLISDDGKTFIANRTALQELYVWNTKTGKLLHVLSSPTQDENLGGLLMSPDGTTLAALRVSNRRQTFHLWSIVSGKHLSTIATDEDRSMPFSLGYGPDFPFVTLSPDGRLLAFVSKRYGDRRHRDRLEVWETRTPKRIFDLRLRRRPPPIEFSPNGQLLTAATVPPLLWDVRHNKQAFPDLQPPRIDSAPTGLLGLPSYARLSPDGRLLALVWIQHGDVAVREVASGRKIAIFATGDAPVMPTFSDDGTLLITHGRDSDPLVWDLTLGTPKGPLRDVELKNLWIDLSGKDARVARRAVLRLPAAGPRTLKFLESQLQPRKIDDLQIRKLIKELDADAFPVRQKAGQQLQLQARLLEPRLRQELKATKSLEVRRQLRGILASIGVTISSPDVLRRVRAVEVLERIGTAEARQQLRTLSLGLSSAPETQAAKAALFRLNRSPQPRLDRDDHN